MYLNHYLFGYMDGEHNLKLAILQSEPPHPRANAVLFCAMISAPIALALVDAGVVQLVTSLDEVEGFQA